MNCYDKIKIITSIDYISNINTKAFNTTVKDDEVIYYKYRQETPFNLIIIVNYQQNELSIEFTGKILLDNYSKLISRDTIKLCFQQINSLGICVVDYDKILHDSKVVKCDNTKDVDCQNISDIIKTVRTNLKNYRKWVIKEYRGGITIENSVKSPRHKKRLSIYDKGKELQKANNTPFLNTISNHKYLNKYFENKIRFELNLNSMGQIRKLLNIPDNSLLNVLNAPCNPILAVIDESIKFSDTIQPQELCLKDYERLLLIKDCDYNLAKVEAKIRSLIPKTTSVSLKMKPYRELFNRLESANTKSVDLRKLVYSSPIL